MSDQENSAGKPMHDTVLLIDDDPEVVWATTRLLVDAGYRVLNGFTAADALQMTLEQRPALLLLDVELPDGNGIEVARCVKGHAELADVFVVLVSGVRITPKEQAEGLRGGLADGYLTRPFSKVEFLARMEAFLRMREVQVALRDSEGQFRQMAESIEEVFWLGSPGAAAILYASPAFERVWGRSCAELYADPRIWIDSVHPEDLPRVRRDLGELARGASIDTEYRITRPDGTLRWISNRGYPMQDGSGRVAGVASDVTSRKQAEETRNLYARRLILLEEDLRKRISLELHDEIGQSLAALGFNLGHIGNHLPAGAGPELRARLEESQGLVKEVVRSARQLMGELRPLLLDDFGLAEAARLYVERFGQRSGIAAVTELDPVFPRLKNREEITLFRILQEALNNVLKHSGASHATVNLCREGDLVRLSVRDDGCGFFPAPAIPRPTGSGWGIAIMRERAALVGASLQVESAPGAGTLVLVELPVEP
jgi:two-component system, NarL family, sensor histidine kinase UhpB